MRPCERSQNKGYRSPLGDVSLESKPFSSTIPESKSSNEKPKSYREQVALESTFSQSHDSSSTILESQTPKPYSNFHFQDIFGNFHRFFRPYTYRFRALFVRVYPQAYCYSDDSEIVITKSHKAIITASAHFLCESIRKPTAIAMIAR